MTETSKILDTVTNLSNRGWFPDGSGGLAVLQKIHDNSQKIYVTPHKLQKLVPNDLFLLRNLYGEHDIQFPLNKVENSLEMSPWTSIFLEILGQKPNSSCVAAVHTKWSTLASRAAFHIWRKKSESYPNLLRLSHWGLIKDITGKNEMFIPIVNYADMGTMLAKTKEALSLYPESCAILIRDYAMVVWEKSLGLLESRAEAIEYLCELQVADFNLFSSYNDSLL